MQKSKKEDIMDNFQEIDKKYSTKITSLINQIKNAKSEKEKTKILKQIKDIKNKYILKLDGKHETKKIYKKNRERKGNKKL